MVGGLLSMTLTQKITAHDTFFRSVTYLNAHGYMMDDHTVKATTKDGKDVSTETFRLKFIYVLLVLRQSSLTLKHSLKHLLIREIRSACTDDEHSP